MRKPKAQEKILLLSNSDTFSNYDPITLLAALNALENSVGWKVFVNFVYYNAAVHGTMSNDLIQQSGKIMEACAAGAKAEVLREVIDKFLEQLKMKAKGNDGVVQPEIPEE